jgi:hypothetical protein
VRVPVPLRDPLAAGVEDELGHRTARHCPHPLVQRIVHIRRRRAAIHRHDVAFRVVGVAVVAVVGHVARRVVSEAGDLVVGRVDAVLRRRPAARPVKFENLSSLS